MAMDQQTKMNLNVFLIGLSFLLLFTAFQTMSNIQTVIIENAKNESSLGYVEGFNGDGYISLAIVYAVSGVFNWFAPSAMSVMGLKLTMIVAASTYVLYIASFFKLMDVLLYGTSALMGVGAAFLWTTQGVFLTVNSNPKDMSRNSGIFWAMLECSLLIGNTFAYFQFRDIEDIDPNTRTIFVAALFSSAVVGFLCFFTLLPTPWATEQLSKTMGSPLDALKNSVALFRTKEILFLTLYFFYMGMQLTFWSGVYGPCLGFTLSFDNNKGMTGLHGIFIGAGEIVAGTIFGIFGHLTNRYGRWPVVVLGTFLQFVAFVLIVLNIPNEAPFGETTDLAILGDSDEVLAIFCSFLLGFGDACYNTQTLSLLGGVYPDRAGPAFAIFKFVKSVAAAAGFVYAGYIPLYYHVGMLFLLGTLGTGVFVYIDVLTKKDERFRVRERLLLQQEEEEEKVDRKTDTDVKG